MRFIFYHGWGLCNHFWHYLAPFFADYECIFLEAGYFGTQKNTIKIPNDNIKNIGIGHSLGFAKLALMSEIKWHKIISIGGFAKFINKPETLKNLDYTRNTLKLDPKKSLLLFYQLAGLNDEFWKSFLYKAIINQNLLLHDLDFLEKINIQIPQNTLHILGTFDRIVDHKNLVGAKNIILPFAGHSLGYTNAELVFSQINSFII